MKDKIERGKKSKLTYKSYSDLIIGMLSTDADIIEKLKLAKVAHHVALEYDYFPSDSDTIKEGIALFDENYDKFLDVVKTFDEFRGRSPSDIIIMIFALIGKL